MGTQIGALEGGEMSGMIGRYIYRYTHFSIVNNARMEWE